MDFYKAVQRNPEQSQNPITKGVRANLEAGQ